MINLKECYECNREVLVLNSNSRCITCVTKRLAFNEAENEALRGELLHLKKHLSVDSNELLCNTYRLEQALHNISAAWCGHYADVPMEEAVQREIIKAEKLLEELSDG